MGRPRIEDPVGKRTEKDYEYMRKYAAAYSKSEAGKAAKKRYEEDLVRVVLRLNPKYDSDILEYLAQDTGLPLATKIKAMLRELIAVKQLVR